MHFDLGGRRELDGSLGCAARFELRETLAIPRELLERALLRTALGPGPRLLRHWRQARAYFISSVRSCYLHERLLVELDLGHSC